MVQRPDPRCLPLELEMLSLHRADDRFRGVARRHPTGSRTARLRLQLARIVNGPLRRKQS